MLSNTPKPYCSVLLTRWTCASFQSTIVPSIQILSAFSIRLPDHLLAASRSTIVWPPIATYAVNIDCPRPAGCTAWGWMQPASNRSPSQIPCYTSTQRRPEKPLVDTGGRVDSGVVDESPC